MAITLLQPFNFDSSKDYTFANVTVTANIQSGNANLGNAATANYFIGNGAYLTGLPASYANSNVANYLPTFTGNISAGNANLGNATTANYFIGNGAYLTGLPASYANSNVANYLPTFTGNISAGNANLGNLATANYFTGTLTTAAQPNITSIGSLTGLTVSNTTGIVNFTTTANVTLGAVSNLHITGGTSGYVLQTDGTGGLSWAAQAGSGFIISGITKANPGVVTVTSDYNFLNGDPIVISGVVGMTQVNNQPYYAKTTGYTARTFGLYSDAALTTAVDTSGFTTYSADGIVSGRATVAVAGSNTGVQFNDSGVFGASTAFTFNKSSNTLTVTNANITSNISVGSGTGGNITGANIISANYFIGAGNALSNITAANITGTVANANYSLYAGTVLTAAQPNITSVGTLTNTTMGSSNSLSGGNLVSATYLTGTLTTAAQPNITSVGTLTNTTLGGANSLTGGNLVSANYITGTLTTAAQPNITSVGTLSSLSVTANITSGNANLGNLVTANYYSGNGSLLTAIAGANVTGTVANATYSVSAGSATTAGTVTTNAQPNITSVGTLTSLDVTANVAAGNILTNNLLYANGVAWSFGSTYANSNVANYLPTYSGNLTSGNASLGNLTTSNYFSGNGSLLTAITGANVSGTVANATYAVSAGSATTAGTVTTNAQPNITSVGTLSNLTVSGSATIGTAAYGALALDGTNGITTSLSSAEHAAPWTISFWMYIPTQTISFPRGLFYTPATNFSFVYGWNGGSNWRLGLTANGMTYCDVNFASPLNQNTWYFVSVSYDGSSVYIGLDGVVTSFSGRTISATGSGVTFGLNTITDGGANSFGPHDLADISVIAGTALYTSNFTKPTTHPSQASGQRLLLLTKTSSTFLYDEVSAANVSYVTAIPTFYNSNPIGATGNVLSYANVTAQYFIGNGSTLTSITGANVSGTVANATYAVSAGSATTAGTVTTNAQPNITSVGTLSSLIVTANANVGNLNSAGQVNGVDALFTGNLTVQGNTTYVNVETFRVEDPVIELGGGANGAPLTTNDGKDRGTLLHYYTTTTVDAFMGWDNSNAEFAFGSNVSVSSDVVTFNSLGNVRAGYFIGNGSLLTGLPATYANSDVANYLPTYTGNITSANIITASGNITAAYFIGNGATLTSIAGANVSGTVANATYATSAGSATTAGTVTTAAQPNITSFGTLTGLNSNGTVNFSNSTNVTLGSVSTLHITGGTNGYVLQTDGTGNLTWTAQTGGGGGSVAGANTEVQYNNAGAFGATAAFTFNNVSNTLTSENITATGNISAVNANLGNAVTANYFIGTFYGTANSAGNATTAGTVTTAAQPNITSTGTLTSLTVSGLLTATGTGIKAANIQDSTGTTAITTRYGSVTGAVGIYSDLTVGTSGTGNLSVNGNSNLGSNSNVYISGGSADYVLSTDGAGNLSWVAQTGGGGGGGSSIANGTSNVNIATSGGNITMTVAGIANVLTVTNTGIVLSGNATLGSNSNVLISGGTSGQVLATNGDGTLYWTTAGSAVVYQLDDLSNYTDGVINTFMLAYNQNIVPISDPFGILVTINGAVQPAFVWNTDVVWQSFTLPAYKGYTIIDAGYLTFTDPPPAGAEIMVRTVTGTTNTAIRRYPFIPGDIMLG